MVLEEKTISKLREHFDLNLYEVKIWTTLLSRGISTAGELSDIANVPRSRTYDVLESLERRGFVVMNLGKPIRYLAIPPEEVIERVKKNYKLQINEKAKELETLMDSDVLKELQGLYEKGIEMIDPSELSGALRGRHNLHDHLDLMIKDATRSVCIMTSSAELNRIAEFHLMTLKDVRSKGVEVKIATPITKENLESAKSLIGVAQIRNVEHIKARFYIIDGEEVLFMLLPETEVHPTYDTGIWVHSPFFGSALEDLFEHAWEHLDEGQTVINKVSLKGS